MALEEIILTVGNHPGALQKVAKILAEGRINVAALSIQSSGARGYIRMVVSDTERALWLLRKAGCKVDADELVVIGLEDKAGNFLRVLDILAKHKINVSSATVLVVRDGHKSLVAIAVNNPSRAKALLHEAGVLYPDAENVITNAGLVASSVVDENRESVGLLL